MASVVFTEPAEYDLLDIEYYIFTENSGWYFGYGRETGRLSDKTSIRK